MLSIIRVEVQFAVGRVRIVIRGQVTHMMIWDDEGYFKTVCLLYP
jgi:hypothetical protein